MPMLCLGPFLFGLDTLPYQSFQHQTGWRHPGNSRVGARPAHQFTGPDDETVTLQGLLLPEITGGRLSLAVLRMMADTGKAWVLIDGTGILYGMFVVETLTQTKTLFFKDGAPRRIEFSLTLKRVDDGLIDMIGDFLTGDWLGLG